MDLVPDFANTPVSPERPRFDYLPDGGRLAPAVSVITPYYNTGAVFLETAQSMLLQSLQQWEWVIVNSGSSEPETAQILDGFRDKDPRIRVIDLGKNQGAPAGRNVGIQQAEAKLIFFLDSDDLIEPTALEKMAWCLESHPEFGFCKGLTVAFGAQQYASKIGFENKSLFLQQNPITILAMVRQAVLSDVEGFDETLRTGLEDWDFWLSCAAQGYWGFTIPEHLDWYRRRQDHGERWASWSRKGIKEMRRELRRRYPELFANGLPAIGPRPVEPYDSLQQDVPFANPIIKKKKRILAILPWMALGGADKFNVDFLTLLIERGYEISIATTLPANYAWFRRFAKLTPDIFILPHFLKFNDYPRFLHYLIRSRNMDLVLFSNSELGYRYLPYLRSRCPEATFVDYCHMEEEYWHNGGHPRAAVAYQEMLDLNIVSSQHLKDWMVGRGADPSRIETCYTNIDAELYSPNASLRSRTRADLQIPPDIPVLLYAGRLCEQKQPKVFAPVMRELKDRKLRFICLVAGDGEDRKWLARYIARHRLKRHVRMLGAVKHERMQELLAASDIFFLPSKMEGISLAIYEAMSMGVVPVGADVGGQRELVTEDCGVLIKRGSNQDEVTAYSGVLESLIKSPERCKNLGNAARDRVCTHFKLEQMGERMDHLLELAQRSRRPRSTIMAGTGLATEHAVLAIECERISRVAAPLWKYHKVEAALWRTSRLASPIVAQARRLAWHLRPLARPVRKAKDAIWILGHKLKVRILQSEEHE